MSEYTHIHRLLLQARHDLASLLHPLTKDSPFTGVLRLLDQVLELLDPRMTGEVPPDSGQVSTQNHRSQNSQPSTHMKHGTQGSNTPTLPTPPQTPEPLYPQPVGLEKPSSHLYGDRGVGGRAGGYSIRDENVVCTYDSDPKGHGEGSTDSDESSSEVADVEKGHTEVGSTQGGDKVGVVDVEKQVTHPEQGRDSNSVVGMSKKRGRYTNSGSTDLNEQGSEVGGTQKCGAGVRSSEIDRYGDIPYSEISPPSQQIGD